MDKIFSCGQKFSAIVLLGDFNAHYNFSDLCLPRTDIGVKLFNFLECNNLYQLIDEPTRIASSGESILDLIISDSPVFCFVLFFSRPLVLLVRQKIATTKSFMLLDIGVYKPKSFTRSVWNLNNVV